MPTRKRIWRAGAATLVTGTTAVVALATSSGHAAAADTYPALAGITTVTTSTSGVATVELKQAARINLGFSFGPEGKAAGPATSTGIEGDGRMIAMVLERGGHAVFDYFGVRDCSTVGCEGDFQATFPFTRPRRLTLNPGVYNLYVVADGAPVTATLSLNGIPGSTTIALTPEQGIVEQSATPLIPSTGVVDPALYSASGQANIGDLGGIMLGDYVVSTASWEATYQGVCYGQGAAPPVYAVGCAFPPDGDTVGNAATPDADCGPFACFPAAAVADATTPSSLPFWWGYPPKYVHPGQGGTWSQGAYFEGAAVLTSEGGTGLWLPFVAPAAPAGSTQQAVPSPSASPSPTATATPSPTPTPTPISAVQAATNLPNTAGSDGGMTEGGLLAGAMLAFGTAWGVSRRRRNAP